MNDEVKTYELGYLLSPFVAEEAMPAQLEQIRAAISEAGGTAKEEGRPQMKTLSYNIGKFEQAWFGHIRFTLSPEKVAEVNAGLSKNENLVRLSIMQTTKELPVARVRPLRTYSKPLKKPAEKLTHEAEQVIDKEIEELIK